MKKIAITLGDPSGIGPEIILKALTRNPKLYNSVIPIVFGHRQLIHRIAGALNLQLPITQLSSISNLPDISDNRIYCYAESELTETPPVGQINALSGQLAFEYIRSAIKKANTGEIDAVTTAPINKEALRLAKIPYLDHTEMFSKLTDSNSTMTLFMTGALRIFFLTRHIALKDVASALNEEEIIIALKNSSAYLKQIGIQNPRIAVAALNPHGGEHGLFGYEEDEIILPAIQKSIQDGLDVYGPIPADSVFHLAKEGQFDAVLALYHDQGHIASKTLDFHKTVSFTMGLPFLRTSPDHGTAMDIAGKNRANETSMLEAIKAAAQFAW